MKSKILILLAVLLVMVFGVVALLSTTLHFPEANTVQ